MFYRGRLTSESVKVFIVGQEGAQDEKPVKSKLHRINWHKNAKILIT